MSAANGYVVIMFFFGLAGGIVGRIKGSSFFLWFLISALVPFLGLLTAIFYRWENQELRRQCPTCGRVVKLHDAVCMRCGEELEFPDVAIASEASDARARGLVHSRTSAVRLAGPPRARNVLRASNNPSRERRRSACVQSTP